MMVNNPQQNTAKGSSTIFTAIYDEDRAAWSDV